MASRAKIAPSNDCNMKCPGDGTVFCGGSWRMNIYSIKENEGEIDSLNLKMKNVVLSEFTHLHSNFNIPK